MKTIVFIFNSDQKQKECKTLVLDVKYLTLGFAYPVEVNQKVDEKLSYSIVNIGNISFPLYKELNVIDILNEIIF